MSLVLETTLKTARVVSCVQFDASEEYLAVPHEGASIAIWLVNHLDLPVGLLCFYSLPITHSHYFHAAVVSEGPQKTGELLVSGWEESLFSCRRYHHTMEHKWFQRRCTER